MINKEEFSVILNVYNSIYKRFLKNHYPDLDIPNLHIPKNFYTLDGDTILKYILVDARTSDASKSFYPPINLLKKLASSDKDFRIFLFYRVVGMPEVKMIPIDEFAKMIRFRTLDEIEDYIDV